MGGNCTTGTMDESVERGVYNFNCAMKSTDSTKDVSKNSSDSLMTSNHRALDCYICFRRLTIPVFQCDNGHIVCSTCCPKLKNKCKKCSLPVSSERCKGIENLLLYIGMSCPNTKYGCEEKIIFIKNTYHGEECIHMPCNCPLLGCDFVASSEDLSNHFSCKHGDLLIKFSYRHSFFVPLKSNDETIFLQEKNDGKLFILNNSMTVLGNAVNICCIGPKSDELEYAYDINVGSQMHAIKFQSFAKIVQQFTSANLSSEFLMIRFDSSGPPVLTICITSSMIQIIIVTNTGKKIPLMVKPSDPILDVKKKIFDKEHFPPVHQQKLILNGNKQLKSRLTIANYNIQDKTELNLVWRCNSTWYGYGAAFEIR